MTSLKLYNKLYYKLAGIICSRYPEFFSANFKVLFSKYIYHAFTGKYLNLRNPKNINEKIMWLKLYYANSLITKCTDKLRVREYVTEKGLSDVLNELYGVYNSVNEIDFNKLPDRFALKANHGCGYNIICSDKTTLDIKESGEKLNVWLNSVYGLRYGEWHYSEIKPKIICEKYLDHSVNSTSIVDYKIHCLNGSPYCFLTVSERKGKTAIKSSYDLQWNKINLLKKEGDVVAKPHNLALMIQIASVLANPFPYVRVDFYEIEGRLYFGELTFTPHGGMMINYTDEALDVMGEQLILPKKNRRRIPFFA